MNRRPIHHREVKKLSIIRNPGTGPLLERLRDKPMQGPIGFHHPMRQETPDELYDRLVAGRFRPDDFDLTERWNFAEQKKEMMRWKTHTKP